MVTQGYPHIISPVPSDRRGADATVVALDQLPDFGVIGKLYNPQECPERLLEAMYYQFRALPLYWASNPIALRRRIYENFYVPGDGAGGNPDGILPNKGAHRALALFSNAVGVAYRLTFRRSSTGKKLGVTLYVTALNREFFDITPGGQAYLEEAYRFLLPARYVVDGIIFEDNLPLPVYIHYGTMLSIERQELA